MSNQLPRQSPSSLVPRSCRKTTPARKPGGPFQKFTIDVLKFYFTAKGSVPY